MAGKAMNLTFPCEWVTGGQFAYLKLKQESAYFASIDGTHWILYHPYLDKTLAKGFCTSLEDGQEKIENKLRTEGWL